MVEKSQPCLLDKREEWSGNSNWPQPVELKALTCKSKATSVESNQVQVPLDRSGLEFTLHGPYTRTQVTGLGLGLRLGRGLGFGLGLDRGYGLRLGLGLGLGLQWAAKVGSTRQFMAHINNPLGSLLFIWLSPGQLCNARINKQTQRPAAKVRIQSLTSYCVNVMASQAKKLVADSGSLNKLKAIENEVTIYMLHKIFIV